MKIAWRMTSVDDVWRTVLDTVRGKEVERKSGDVVAWAFGSWCFERTWKQKEPRQFLCAGVTPTGVMRVDQNTDLDWS